jgi:hypothetical protein
MTTIQWNIFEMTMVPTFFGLFLFPVAPNLDVECNKYMFYFSLNSSVYVFIFKEKLKAENLYFQVIVNPWDDISK